jgi:plasmid stabilization system protein ParE
MGGKTRVVWLNSAVTDLTLIRDYIAGDSEAYAAAVAKRVYDATRLLADFPLIGRIVPEWEDPNIRDRIVFNYRVIYRVYPEEVRILGIIHGARQLPNEIRHRDS